MKSDTKQFSLPDGFTSSPLLALVPSLGKVNRLHSYTSSIYARYEKVSEIAKELLSSDDVEAKRRCQAEENMLREVLEWLAVKPKQEQSDL